MGIDFGAIVANANQDHAVGESCAFANTVTIDDHEALRWIVGIHMHADLQGWQRIAFCSRQTTQWNQFGLIGDCRWVRCGRDQRRRRR